MLHSTFVHAGGELVHVHYLHSPRLEQRQREALTSMVTALGGAIDFYLIPDEDLVGLPSTPQFTSAMWYRLFLPDLLTHVDRVLYLDADTIAVDSLAPLWATDLTSYWVGAVTNVFQHNHRHRPAQLGLAGPEEYFNSGVLLMNLAEMRGDDCTASMLRYARTHPDIEWPDQDTLNVVLGPRRFALHPRWNFMNSMMIFDDAASAFEPGVLQEARLRPAIRHFEGPAENKPWNYMCDRALRDVYFEHRRATPWPDVEVEDATIASALKRRWRGWRRRLSA
jgi:lipopolysaccharide biosynthesis glycosyltransferase